MRKTGHPVEPEELMAYLDGELAPARASEAVTHLERCGECQRLAEELRGVSREMTAWEVEGTEFGLRDALVPVVLRAKRRRWWVWASAGVAAALVGCLGLALMPLREQRFNSVVTVDPSAADKFKARNPLTILRGRVTPVARAEGYTELTNDVFFALIAKTAEITIVAADFGGVRLRLDRILSAREGYESQLTVAAGVNGPHSIEGTLSVPAAQLEAALTDLRKLGRVQSESQNGIDVTAQTVDLEARMSSARTTEKRLLQLASDRSGGLKDVLAVESELRRVRGNIESMEAERKSLAMRVERSFITVHISEEERQQLGSNDVGLRLRNAGVEGVSSMRDSLIDAGVLIGSRGPVVLLWVAILFFPVRLVWRRWRRRRVG